MRTLTDEERTEMEAALELVQQTQTDFWMAMGDLEGLLNEVELDGNVDFEDYDVDALLAMEDETEEEETEDDVR